MPSTRRRAARKTPPMLKRMSRVRRFMVLLLGDPLIAVDQLVKPLTDDHRRFAEPRSGTEVPLRGDLRQTSERRMAKASWAPTLPAPVCHQGRVEPPFTRQMLPAAQREAGDTRYRMRN